MKFGKTGQIKNQAKTFLNQYESQGPAAYAAALQAVGGVVILDSSIGIDSPQSGKRRRGSLVSLAGIFVGVIFVLVPTFFGNFSGTKSMTSTTTARVVSVDKHAISSSGGNSCSAIVNYRVKEQTYQTQSAFNSSNVCGLAPGSTITIDYRPSQPGAWGYNVKSIDKILSLIRYAGILVIIISLIIFVIRLASLIFGWKLFKKGRALAKTLPPGTNLNSAREQIKREFKRHIFGSGRGSLFTKMDQTFQQPVAQPAAQPMAQPTQNNYARPIAQPAQSPQNPYARPMAPPPRPPLPSPSQPPNTVTAPVRPEMPLTAPSPPPQPAPPSNPQLSNFPQTPPRPPRQPLLQ